MAVQATVAERWKEATGCVLTQAWGLTETSPAACINPNDEPFNGSIGLPISSTEIAIKDDAGNDLPLGQIGEICVRGPQVMRGYWNRPDETAKVMLPGGWLRTGDVGHMDERGFVYIEDRKKDMILVSGFNVYPNEVEAAAVTCPGILEAAAVAQPDEHSGEVVALFVVRKDPALTERGSHRLLPPVPGGLQDPEARVLQDRTAEDQRGEDIEEGIERGIGKILNGATAYQRPARLFRRYVRVCMYARPHGSVHSSARRAPRAPRFEPIVYCPQERPPLYLSECLELRDVLARKIRHFSESFYQWRKVSSGAHILAYCF